MRKILTLTIAISLAIFSFANKANAQQAPNFNYNYGEISYLNHDFGSGVKQDGFELAGSLQIQPNISIFGSISPRKTKWRLYTSDDDVLYLSIGGKYMMPLPVKNMKMDLAPHGSLYRVSTERDSCGYSTRLRRVVCSKRTDSEIAFIAGAELRAAINNQFELFADGSLDTKGSKSRSSAIILTGGARFWATDNIGFYASLGLSDVTRLRLGARMNF